MTINFRRHNFGLERPNFGRVDFRAICLFTEYTLQSQVVFFPKINHSFRSREISMKSDVQDRLKRFAGRELSQGKGTDAAHS